MKKRIRKRARIRTRRQRIARRNIVRSFKSVIAGLTNRFWSGPESGIQTADLDEVRAYQTQQQIDAALEDLRLSLARTEREAATKEGSPKCDECGQEITSKRLQAHPGASRCLECQNDLENVFDIRFKIA